MEKLDMTLHLELPENNVLKPSITVFGVGGAGGNAVNNMVSSDLEGVSFVAANTDAQSLENSLASKKIQLGLNTTKGLGAGSTPQVGCAAAEESIEEVRENLENSNMVFITAGMGGGTGTGAAPVIAKIAREEGILTVGVVTKPFHFEGAHRMRTAEAGLAELQKYVDTLIIIPNQNLFRIANENTTFADAFKMADDVLHSGVRGITDLMIMPGLINLDFADIRSVMGEMGKAMMGTGEASEEGRAIKAAESAIANPLLDNVSMKGARGVLINITGGYDMTLFEVDEAANRIREEVDEDANIIFGSTFNPEMDGKIRVSVVATGIDVEEVQQNQRANEALAYKSEAPKPIVEPRAEAINDIVNSFQNTQSSTNASQQDNQEQGEQNSNELNENMSVPENQSEEDNEDNIESFADSISKLSQEYSQSINENDSPTIEDIVNNEISKEPKQADMFAPEPEASKEEKKAPVGLFGRMANVAKSFQGFNETNETVNISKAENKRDEDEDLDIPAFLRKN